MKKLTKLGVVTMSVLALNAVAPAVLPEIFVGQVVYAEENDPKAFTIIYYDKQTDNRIAGVEDMYGTVNPGETVTIGKDIPGYKKLYSSDTMSYDGLRSEDDDTYQEIRSGMYIKSLPYEKLPEEQPTVPSVQPSEEPKEEPTTPPVAPTEDPSKPAEEVKPETKPEEQPKPSEQPQENPKPEEKPQEQPKPETKPSWETKPEVKPETKPSETPKPEVKPSSNPSSQTGSTTAPTTPAKLAGQISNAQADKPVSKTETPAPKVETKPEAKPATNNVAKKADGTVNTAALPNTGEQNSVLAVLFGFVALALGLFGFRKKSE